MRRKKIFRRQSPSSYDTITDTESIVQFGLPTIDEFERVPRQENGTQYSRNTQPQGDVAGKNPPDQRDDDQQQSDRDIIQMGIFDAGIQTLFAALKLKAQLVVIAEHSERIDSRSG